MTIANNITALALRNAGVTGVGQTPSTQDSADAFTLLNDMILQWIRERAVLVIPTTLAVFPDQTTDQPAWNAYENVLLTCLTVRLRNAYGLPPDDLMVKLAESALSTFQANNKQFQPALHPGLVTTCIQAIHLALRYAGRVTDQQSVSDTSQDVNDAFAMLVAMVGQWQRKRWLVYDLTETTIVSTGGSQYTVGPGAQFAIPRPDRIEAAFARLLPAPTSTIISGQLINNGGVVTVTSGGSLPTSPVGLAPGSYWNNGGVLMIVSGSVTPSFGSTIDYPLSILESREDYARIALKTFQTIPASVFYDAAWPTGSLYFWPVPPVAQYELHIFTKASLQVYSSTSDALNLPPEYTEALIYNLALRLPGGNVSPAIAGLARASLNTIRMANTQVAAMQMPRGLASGARRGSDYASFMSGL